MKQLQHGSFFDPDEGDEEEQFRCPACDDWTGQEQDVLSHIMKSHSHFMDFLQQQQQQQQQRPLRPLQVLSTCLATSDETSNDDGALFPEFSSRHWKALRNLPHMMDTSLEVLGPVSMQHDTRASHLISLHSVGLSSVSASSNLVSLPCEERLGKWRTFPAVPSFVDNKVAARIRQEIQAGLLTRQPSHGVGERPEQRVVPIVQPEWLSERSRKALKEMGITKVPFVKRWTQWPAWISDDELYSCSKCQSMFFPLFRRKHHCRVCGRGFCETCCDGFRVLPLFGSSVSCRVCQECSEAQWQREGEFWSEAPYKTFAMRLNYLRVALDVYEAKLEVRDVPLTFPEGPQLLIVYGAEESEWEALVTRMCSEGNFADAFDTLDLGNERGFNLKSAKWELAMRFEKHRWALIGSAKLSAEDLVQFGEEILMTENIPVVSDSAVAWRLANKTEEQWSRRFKDYYLKHLERPWLALQCLAFFKSEMSDWVELMDHLEIRSPAMAIVCACFEAHFAGLPNKWERLADVAEVAGNLRLVAFTYAQRRVFDMSLWLSLSSRCVFSNPQMAKHCIVRALRCVGSIQAEELLLQMAEVAKKNLVLSLVYGIAATFLVGDLKEDPWLWLAHRMEDAKLFILSCMCRKCLVDSDDDLAPFYSLMATKQDSRRKVIECYACAVWLSQDSEAYMFQTSLKAARCLLEFGLYVNALRLLLSLQDMSRSQGRTILAKYRLLTLDALTRRLEQ